MAGKLFYLTYRTSLDSIQMEITAPDGSVSGPLSWSGPGEHESGILIPPMDDRFSEQPQHYNRIIQAHIALGGTYKFTVYDRSGTTKVWEKEFTFQGPKLVVKEAKITQWKWQWSWPVALFWPREIAVTVSNEGDLPSPAIIVIRFDDLNRPDDDQAEWLFLGFVPPGETRSFSIDEHLQSFMAKVNFRRVGDLIPPSTHTLSVTLVGDLPSPAKTEGFPQQALQYYKLPQFPYRIMKFKLPGEPELLLVDDYSTAVHTPPVQTG